MWRIGGELKPNLTHMANKPRNWNRIYQGIFEGSMFGRGAILMATWTYVLSNMVPNFKDKNFYVTINIPLLAAILGEAKEDVERAVTELCSEDPHSQMKTEEGRRLVQTGSFEYRVVNGAAYNDIRRREVKREEWREIKRRKSQEAAERKGKRPSGSVTRNEQQFSAALERGDVPEADRIVAMGLPGEGQTRREGTVVPPAIPPGVLSAGAEQIGLPPV